MLRTWEKYNSTGLMPRSYIYSLYQQVDKLERQIRAEKDNCLNINSRNVPSNSVEGRPSATFTEQYDFVGSSTSVQLFDRLCRLSVLFPRDRSISLESPTPLDLQRPAAELHPFLPVETIEVESFLTPGIQSDLLRYFSLRVSSKLPSVLSGHQERIVLLQENPLSVCGRDFWLPIILLSIFSISARLISRDLQAEYAYLDYLCWDKVEKALANTQNDSFSISGPMYSLDQVRVLCLSIIRELVGPGRSRISLDLLNTAQLLQVVVPRISVHDQAGQESISRIGFFLSQVEA